MKTMAEMMEMGTVESSVLEERQRGLVSGVKECEGVRVGRGVSGCLSGYISTSDFLAHKYLAFPA